MGQSEMVRGFIDGIDPIRTAGGLTAGLQRLEERWNGIKYHKSCDDELALEGALKLFEHNTDMRNEIFRMEETDTDMPGIINKCRNLHHRGRNRYAPPPGAQRRTDIQNRAREAAVPPKPEGKPAGIARDGCYVYYNNGKCHWKEKCRFKSGHKDEPGYLNHKDLESRGGDAGRGKIQPTPENKGGGNRWKAPVRPDGRAMSSNNWRDDTQERNQGKAHLTMKRGDDSDTEDWTTGPTARELKLQEEKDHMHEQLMQMTAMLIQGRATKIPAQPAASHVCYRAVVFDRMRHALQASKTKTKTKPKWDRAPAAKEILSERVRAALRAAAQKVRQGEGKTKTTRSSNNDPIVKATHSAVCRAG